MKLKTIAYLSALSFTLLNQTAHAATTSISFKNQRGSLLELNILADNKVDGYFTTAVASKECPDAIGKKQPIVGYIAGNALSFSVVYPMCGSVLSIIGNLDSKQKTIDTLSLLNRQADDITHQGPGSRLIGHDTYKNIDASKSA